MSDQTHVAQHEVTENYALGIALACAKRTREAADVYSAEPQESPCYALAQGNLSLALIQLGQYERAEEVARHTLGEVERRGCPHPPSHVQFARNLAEAVRHQGRVVESQALFADAIQLADELVTAHPDHEIAIQKEKAHTLSSLAMCAAGLENYELAKDLLNTARDTYREYPSPNLVGHAETLTNLGVIFRKCGEPLKAELALHEAFALVRYSEDVDQRCRILIAAVQLGSSLVDRDETFAILRSGAQHAEERGAYTIAYLRYCITTQVALQMKGIEAGLDAVRAARAIEDQVDGSSPYLSRLRTEHAQLLTLANADRGKILPILIEGCHCWYEFIATLLAPVDAFANSGPRHEHFRLTTRHLIDENRIDEALFVFESGRSLVLTAEVDREFLSRTVCHNPFASDGSHIDTVLLSNSRRTIPDGSCAIVIAAIPREPVAFIIDEHSIETVAVAAESATQANAMIADVCMLPSRLQQGVGRRAVPESILQLAGLIAERVGKREICGFTPHNVFHGVPWRAILRDRGMSWTQLAWSAGFGFLFRGTAGPPAKPSTERVIALGQLSFCQPMPRRGMDALPGNTQQKVAKIAKEDHVGFPSRASRPSVQVLRRLPLAEVLRNRYYYAHHSGQPATAHEPDLARHSRRLQ